MLDAISGYDEAGADEDSMLKWKKMFQSNRRKEVVVKDPEPKLPPRDPDPDPVPGPNPDEPGSDVVPQVDPETPQPQKL